jgi:hypothetical protein
MFTGNMFTGFTAGDHLMFWGFFIVFGLMIAFTIFCVVLCDKGYGDLGRGFRMFLEKFHKEEPETPKALKQLISSPTNRDFVIEMLKLRKETIKKYGYDPFCSLETADEIVAAEKVAAALECLVNKYPDPDGFNRALTSTGLVNYVAKFNNNREN